MGIRKLLLSKWFIYAYIALILFFGTYVILPRFILMEIISPELGLNLYSESIGLFFTLFIFIMLFDTREWLLWKRVEDRVEKRIEIVAQRIFSELSRFCEVNLEERVRKLRSEGDFSKEEFKKDGIRYLDRIRLNSLASGDFKLSDLAKELWKDEKKASLLASSLDSKRTQLSELEGKYLKFLDADLQVSLMDIQGYLSTLSASLTFLRSFIIEVFEGDEENFYESILDGIKKIMVEIAKIYEPETNIAKIS